MQGLPFDESDFPPPPPVTVSTTWMEQSPRLIPSSAPTPAAVTAVTEEELYQMVAAQPPPPPPHVQTVPTPDVIHRYSQQPPVITSAAGVLYTHSHPQPQLQHHTQQTHHHQQQHLPQQPQLPQLPQLPHLPVNSQQQQLQHPSTQSRIPHSAAPASFQQPRRAIQEQVRQVPSRRLRGAVSPTASQGDGKRVVRPPAPPHMVQPESSTSKQPIERDRDPIGSSTSGGAGPSTAVYSPKGAPRKPVRSAVEEARLRAQREAESFANSRRDPTKREASIAGPSGKGGDTSGWEGAGDRRAGKRSRQEADSLGTGEVQASRKMSSKQVIERGEERSRHDEDSEAEKQERYKRRLDMNRESAAVSRVRRRVYVKELEQRLAAVEAEKLQLEGKLEVMQSQNEGYKKQLERLFLMVASGRRPTYPPPPDEGSQEQ